MTLDNWNNLTVEDQEKIFKAIDRLAKDNPGIADQLTALANMKEERPLRFKMALALLKTT